MQTEKNLTYKVVSTSGVNVRKEANTDSAIIKILDLNEEFTGIPSEENIGIWVKTEDGFVCIETDSGYVLAKQI